VRLEQGNGKFTTEDTEFAGKREENGKEEREKGKGEPQDPGTHSVPGPPGTRPGTRGEKGLDEHDDGGERLRLRSFASLRMTG